MLIWIIDEEWKDYDMEKAILEAKYPGVTIKVSNYNYASDLQAFGHKADGILAQVYAPLPASTIKQLECCKGIAVYGGGYDRVDVQAAREKGISVTNISGYCAEDLADYVVAAMYFANKRISQYNDTVVEDCRHNRWGAMAVPRIGNRLSTQTLCVLGFGVIGKTVAARAKALGINVIAIDDFVPVETIEALGVKKVSWEEGFTQADYVSIHLKGCDENKDKVNAHYLSLMKPTAWLINTARGKIVDENALIAAVKAHQIEGAILDVIKTEPPTGEEAILHCPGIYVTPHISYISVESFRALKERALENLQNMLEGKTPRDLVN